jgi:carboxymethylenebutenolidase
MNYLALSAVSFFVFLFSFFQKPEIRPVPTSPMAMCHTTDMRDFALDPEFQALHAAPLPLAYEGLGKMVEFPADSLAAKGYCIKAKKKTKKWLFVYQEWWGLNDYIKRQCDAFYTDLGGEVNVIALDMYDGKVTTDPKEAGKTMSEISEKRLENIVKGASKWAGKKAKIANVGWCFGGSWSLKSALICGKKSVGSVMYYGMPVRDVEKLKTLNCDVLGLFATETRISKEVIEDFAAKMTSADKTLNYKIFEGVHGFANPSNPKFDAALASEAYGMALTYLRTKFKN